MINVKIQLTDVTSPLFIILRLGKLELLIDSLFWLSQINHREYNKQITADLN